MAAAAAEDERLSDSDVFELPDSELGDLSEEEEEKEETEQRKQRPEKGEKEETKKAKKTKGLKVVNPLKLKELIKNAKEGSTSALRKLLFLFKEIFLISA